MKRGPVIWEAQPLCPDLQERGPCRARPLQTHLFSVLRIQDLRAAGTWKDRTAHLGAPRRVSGRFSLGIRCLRLRAPGHIASAAGHAHVCAFVDIRKAFDTSWVEATLVRLHQVGVTGGMWRTVANFLCGTLSQVRVCGDVSPPWVDTGIAQGRVLSPLLFKLLVNSLAAAIRRASPGVRVAPHSNLRVTCQLYDDLVILAESEGDLQAALDAVTLWSHRWRFSFGVGPQKSAAMVFGPALSRPSCAVSLNGRLLEVVPSYRYAHTVPAVGRPYRPHSRPWPSAFCTKYLVGPLRRPTCLLLALSALHLRSSQCDFRNGVCWRLHSQSCAAGPRAATMGRHLLGWASGNPCASVL